MRIPPDSGMLYASIKDDLDQSKFLFSTVVGVKYGRLECMAATIDLRYLPGSSNCTLFPAWKQKRPFSRKPCRLLKGDSFPQYGKEEGQLESTLLEIAPGCAKLRPLCGPIVWPESRCFTLFVHKVPKKCSFPQKRAFLKNCRLRGWEQKTTMPNEDQGVSCKTVSVC